MKFVPLFLRVWKISIGWEAPFRYANRSSVLGPILLSSTGYVGQKTKWISYSVAIPSQWYYLNLPVLQFSFRLLVGDQIQQILSPGLHFLHKVDQGQRKIQQLWLPAKYETKIIRLWETTHLSLLRS